MTQALFERLKVWVTELKTDAATMQLQYEKAVSELQVSIEQAHNIMTSAGSKSPLPSTSTDAVIMSKPAGQSGLSPPSVMTLTTAALANRVPTGDPAPSLVDLFLSTPSVVASSDRLSAALNWLSTSLHPRDHDVSRGGREEPTARSDRIRLYVSPELGPTGLGPSVSPPERVELSSADPNAAIDALKIGIPCDDTPGATLIVSVWAHPSFSVCVRLVAIPHVCVSVCVSSPAACSPLLPWCLRTVPCPAPDSAAPWMN